MRHKKVISLYDVDPSHAEILDYLESFEGRNRQNNALMQLVIVGHRVMANLESGEEAYFRARNPDVRKVRRDTAPKSPSRKGEREVGARAPQLPNPAIDDKVVIEEGEVVHPLPVKPRPVPIPISQEEPSYEEGPSSSALIHDLDDVVDPLMKLQLLSGD